ncbi:MAG: fused MFS/spermidine synthase [Planctomycetota bacterium]|jgi:tetratricopeptide (TPR) repeat protein
MDTQLLLAHIPMLLHPRPESVMVIGLGSGVTVGSASLHPGSRVTAVEIEPAVRDAAHLFAHVNHDAVNRPNVEVLIEDARTLLVTDDRRWDVVISEPSNPWLSGPAKLFTQEFFTMVRNRLGEHGVFGQWVHVYGLELEHLQAIVRTFHSVFPDVRMFVTLDNADLLLVGGSGAGPIDWDGMERRAAQPDIRDELAGTGAGGIAGICARYLAGPAECAAWAGDGPLNTDDNGFVEFGAGWRGWQKSPREAMREALDELAPDPLPLIGPGTAEWPLERMLGAMAEAAAAREDGERAIRLAQAGLKVRETAAGHRALGFARSEGVAGLAAEESFRTALKLDPTDRAVRHALVRHLIEAGDNADALEILGTPPPDDLPGRALRASALMATGDSEAAFAIFAELPASAFEDPKIPHFEHAGAAALGVGKPQAAVQFLQARLARDPLAPRALMLLIRARKQTGDATDAALLAEALREADRFMEEKEEELDLLYRGEGVSIAFLREGAKRHPFDPTIPARLVALLRLRAMEEGGPGRSAAAVEALEAGRAAFPRHNGSYPLAREHAYTCGWMATAVPEPERAALWAEAARVLRTMLSLRVRLTAERRREMAGRAARYERMAAGR